jgi:hypothetical protein
MSNILEEVNKLLGQGAIELVPPGQEGQGNCDAEGHGSKLVMNSLYTKPQILPVRWKHGNL